MQPRLVLDLPSSCLSFPRTGEYGCEPLRPAYKRFILQSKWFRVEGGRATEQYLERRFWKTKEVLLQMGAGAGSQWALVLESEPS